MGHAPRFRGETRCYLTDVKQLISVLWHRLTRPVGPSACFGSVAVPGHRSRMTKPTQTRPALANSRPCPSCFCGTDIVHEARHMTGRIDTTRKLRGQDR